MKPLYRNIFLTFGLAAVVVLVTTLTTEDMKIGQLTVEAGYYWPALVGLWGLVYLFNARAYQLVVNRLDNQLKMPFRKAYKLTLTGAALGAVTPFGLGGGPYRVMELVHYLGLPRAMSTVVIDCMMQLMTLLLLWAVAMGGFIWSNGAQMNGVLWTIFTIYFILFIPAIALLFYGYRNGLLVQLYRHVFLRLPWGRTPFQRFFDRHGEVMTAVDTYTAQLYARPLQFAQVIGCQLLARICSILEILLLLSAFGISVTFSQALLVLAFSTLFSYLLPFLPLSTTVQSGSYACTVSFLGIASVGIGTLMALYMRLRELFWIAVGVALVKVGNCRLMR